MRGNMTASATKLSTRQIKRPPILVQDAKRHLADSTLSTDTCAPKEAPNVRLLQSKENKDRDRR